MVLNPDVDSYNYLHINNPRARRVVLNFIEEDNLIDVWKVMNEEIKGSTWSRKKPVRKQATLEYFLINECCYHYITDTNIIPGYRLDHSAIVHKLKIQNNERGRGYWKFNNSLLKDLEYIKVVKDTITEVKNIYKGSENENNISDENYC